MNYQPTGMRDQNEIAFDSSYDSPWSLGCASCRTLLGPVEDPLLRRKTRLPAMMISVDRPDCALVQPRSPVSSVNSLSPPGRPIRAALETSSLNRSLGPVIRVCAWKPMRIRPGSKSIRSMAGNVGGEGVGGEGVAPGGFGPTPGVSVGPAFSARAPPCAEPSGFCRNP